MTNARETADKRLLAAVDAVTRARNPTRRMRAVAALRREADGELARLRHENRQWALRVARERHQDLVQAAAASGSGLRDTLEAIAEEIAEVSEQAFATFKATPDDLKMVRDALRRRAGAAWVVSLLAVRTGALDQTPLARATPKRVATMQEALRKTPRA